MDTPAPPNWLDVFLAVGKGLYPLPTRTGWRAYKIRLTRTGSDICLYRKNEKQPTESGKTTSCRVVFVNFRRHIPTQDSNN